jgi:hypothetical protein
VSDFSSGGWLGVQAAELSACRRSAIVGKPKPIALSIPSIDIEIIAVFIFSLFSTFWQNCC